MTILDAFKQDIENNQEQIYSVLASFGYIDAKPTFETIAAIQAKDNDCYQQILLTIYGEEYDNYMHTANANGEGAANVLNSLSNVFSVLNQPITTLNAAISNLGGGNSSNSESISVMESSVAAIEEETSKYRTMSLIAIVICVVIVAIIILR